MNTRINFLLLVAALTLVASAPLLFTSAREIPQSQPDRTRQWQTLHSWQDWERRFSFAVSPGQEQQPSRGPELWDAIELTGAKAKLLQSAKPPAVSSRDGQTGNPTIPPLTPSSTTRDGLRTVVFDTPWGQIRVYLPDDMMAGDTIFGTVRAEPKGQNAEERDKNMSSMGDQKIEIATAKKPDGTSDVNVNVSVTANPSPFTFFLPSSSPIDTVLIGLRGVDLTNRFGQFTGGLTTTVPIEMHSLSLQSVAPLKVPFQLPTIGQQGRPVEIIGPFQVTQPPTLMYGPPGASVQDFEKNTENVSGGFGLIQPLAESPRKCVFGAPTNVTGPIELYLKEGNTQTTGEYRNVRVDLTAQDISLLKGQSTELHCRVTGLKGIKQPVPLTLAFTGVITAEGGPYQYLVIQPSEVDADGSLTTTRRITGVQTGVWGATATVVTHRFDFCLQDDSSPQTVIQWNSFTGDYIFTPSGGTSLSGTGTVTRKDCIITLTDGRPDRKVQSTIDPCTQTGSASVQTSPPNKPKVKFTITDRNTTNNTCSCGPGCK